MALRHMLLSLLQEAPMHGYRLKQCAKEYAWIYPTTNASIYPILHAMEDDGLVSHTTEIHRGRVRKIYEISPSGRDELRRWLGEPDDDDLGVRDKTLLKIALLNDDSLPQARQWIRRSLSRYREEMAEQEKKARRADDETRFGRLTNDYRYQVLQLRMQYLEKVLAESTDEEPRPSRAPSPPRD